MSFEKQIISEDKYSSILFSRQMEAIVFTIEIFFATRAVLKIGLFSDIPQFLLVNIPSRDVFRSIARELKYLMDYNYRYVKI